MTFYYQIKICCVVLFPPTYHIVQENHAVFGYKIGARLVIPSDHCPALCLNHKVRKNYHPHLFVWQQINICFDRFSFRYIFNPIRKDWPFVKGSLHGHLEMQSHIVHYKRERKSCHIPWINSGHPPCSFWWLDEINTVLLYEGRKRNMDLFRKKPLITSSSKTGTWPNRKYICIVKTV